MLSTQIATSTLQGRMTLSVSARPATEAVGVVKELAGLRDFYEANLELATPKSPISIFDVDTTIVSRGKILPPSIIHNCEIHDSLLGEGSVLVVNACPLPATSSR